VSDYPHRTTIQTRWKDNDVYGHVNNVEYHSYVDTVINEYLIVSGGLDPERIRYFKDHGAPVDSFAVGSYISGGSPIDFTGDLKEIDGRAVAKRGRIPGVTDTPRLSRVDLAGWRGEV